MKKIITGSTAQAKENGNQSTSEKQGKFPSQALLVHTVFGVSILHPNSTVYVKIGNEYVVKSADEIKKGEEILFGKEGIPDITIDKVSEALAKSDRYTATQPVLFKQLSDGTYTTAFKDALFHGMVSVQGWPDEITSDYAFKVGAIRGDNVELGGKQAIIAAEHIRYKLNEASVAPVTAYQIRYGWLAGKTIAPFN